MPRLKGGCELLDEGPTCAERRIGISMLQCSFGKLPEVHQTRFGRVERPEDEGIGLLEIGSLLADQGQSACL